MVMMEHRVLQLPTAKKVRQDRQGRNAQDAKQAMKIQLEVAIHAQAGITALMAYHARKYQTAPQV